ncbi:MAG: hypothetical protein JWP91_1022 [Fibrobacteres bacterium]|nr:hypothetical protein [Fibrobacterota bacterium]
MARKTPTSYPARYLPALGRRVIPSLCAIAFLWLNACFQGKPEELAGGGGIETTDGEIIASTGMLQGVRVRLVPEAYDPLASGTFPDSLAAITDAAGHYAFKNVPPGRYNLEAFQPLDGTRLFLPGQIVSTAGSRTLPKAGLARTGRLRLIWDAGHKGQLFIQGTTIVRRIQPAEIEEPVIEIDSLPMGRLPPVFWARTPEDTALVRITDSIDIRPDSATEWAVFAAWAHHGLWHINTTPSGAGIAGDLASVPMLVRLTAAGFDFGQAAPDGRDVRFSDRDGKELGYQVERWDSAAGLAEIWVRVPTVEGNSAAGFFRMHWGNAQADDHSYGPGVFGPMNHFSAVLHLGETGSAAPAGFSDATGSGRTGTGVAMTQATTAAGAVGLGQNLDGVAQWIKVTGSFPTGKAPRSMSAWGKSSNPAVRAHLMDYGSAANLATFGAANDLGHWSIWQWGPFSDYATVAEVDREWHQITLDYDGTSSRIYVDGVRAGIAAKDLATTATGFTIGSSYAGEFPWPGTVDEVTVSTVSRSADWIKMAFENQKPDSKSLTLEILE